MFLANALKGTFIAIQYDITVFGEQNVNTMVFPNVKEKQIKFNTLKTQLHPIKTQ